MLCTFPNDLCENFFLWQLPTWLNMQELTKMLIFLSTLWSTLSADTNYWKKELSSDSPRHASKHSRINIHRQTLPETSRAIPEPSSMFSHKMEQFNFFSPHKNIQIEEESGITTMRNVRSQEVNKDYSVAYNSLHSIEQDVQEPLDTSFTKSENKKNNDSVFSIPIPPQPTWQLPVQKTYEMSKSDKKLKILPISSVHDLWFATNRILMSDLKKDSNRSQILSTNEFKHQPNSTFSDDNYISSRSINITGIQRPLNVDLWDDVPTATRSSGWHDGVRMSKSSKDYHLPEYSFTDDSYPQTNSTSIMNKYYWATTDENMTQIENQTQRKGELATDAEDTAESRGWQNGGMMNGGGQPILLIKDKEESGGGKPWDSGGGDMSKKDVGPLVMMLTPLIMMCIMVPMMMSVMGGMMHFMKNVVGMMMMMHPSWPSPPSTTLVNKHRKAGEEDMEQGRVLLGSLILEIMDKFEEAVSKYDT